MVTWDPREYALHGLDRCERQLPRIKPCTRTYCTSSNTCSHPDGLVIHPPPEQHRLSHLLADLWFRLLDDLVKMLGQRNVLETHLLTVDITSDRWMYDSIALRNKFVHTPHNGLVDAISRLHVEPASGESLRPHGHNCPNHTSTCCVFMNSWSCIPLGFKTDDQVSVTLR